MNIMAKLICDGNTIFEDDRPIGTISMGRSSIDVTGSVSISLKREKGGYSILEDNMPIGKIEKNLKMNYQGKIFEPERKDLYDFVTGKTNSLNIYSLGSVSGKIERENMKLVVNGDVGFDKIPFLIYLTLFSRYRMPAMGTRGRAQALPSPYKEAYYALIFAFFAAFVFLSFFNISSDLYITILLVLIIGQFVIFFMGRKKLSKKE